MLSGFVQIHLQSDQFLEVWIAKTFLRENALVLLMEEILHQLMLVGSLSHYLQGFPSTVAPHLFFVGSNLMMEPEPNGLIGVGLK